ncbi:MAG: hypothetical protein ACRDPH_16900 [Marmoricola sp.]
MTPGPRDRRAGPKRVYWHIGLPKTGTTYLQGLLWANKRALARQGLLLPGPGHRRHLLASLELREDPTLRNRPGDVREPWRKLVAEAQGWGGDVLITHEFFCAASPEQVRRGLAAFPDAEVHVVVTARAMVNLGISRWQEWVRNGGVQDIDSYPPRHDYDPTDAWGWGSFDLADVLDRWGSAVPAERIHVLPMAGGSDPADLWRRFATLVGVDPDSVDASVTEMNRSLGIVETELLRRVNPHLTGFRKPFDRGHWIRGFLARPDVMSPTGERFRPGPEKLADLQRRGERSLVMLRTGGYDVIGDLAQLEPRDVSGYRHPSEVTDTELLDAAVKVVAALMVKVRAVSRRRDNLQKAARRGRGGDNLSALFGTARSRIRDRIRSARG